MPLLPPSPTHRSRARQQRCQPPDTESNRSTTPPGDAQDSDDIRYMVGALKALGIQLEERWEQGEMVVTGCGGRFPVEVRGGGSSNGRMGASSRRAAADAWVTRSSMWAS